MQAAKSPGVIRFGIFEVDLRSGELRRNGLRVKLPEQSFQILAMLLTRAGEVVSREEIGLKLGADDAMVEFDQSSNAAMRRLGLAVGDSAEAPKYVETWARRGYRLLVSVEGVREPGQDAPSEPALKPDISAS